MADLGTIGVEAQPVQRRPLGFIRTLRCGDEYQVNGCKDVSEGNASQPSLRLDAQGKWRFRWRVTSGAHTIQVSVKQAADETPYPSLVVRSNPAIGVSADVVETAAAGGGWKTIGPATINPTSDGVVWVELRNNLDRQFNEAPCYFDHIVAR